MFVIVVTDKRAGVARTFGATLSRAKALAALETTVSLLQGVPVRVEDDYYTVFGQGTDILYTVKIDTCEVF